MPAHTNLLEVPITDIAAEHDVYFGTPEPVHESENLQTASLAVIERVEHRPDVVKVKGRLTLMDTGLTPHQAMVQDLLFVRKILDNAGITYLLVRGNDQRPVIAIDLAHREELRRAMVEACREEPFYARSVDTKKTRTLLIADGELWPADKSRIIRVFRPRAVSGTNLTFGPSAGVQLELWDLTGPAITLPVENSLTRRTLPASEVVRGTVEKHGLTWPTIENMFADHATDIDFDVDLVFSWVDGSSAEYQAARAARMKDAVVGEGDDHEARFRHVNELKYALRSVYMFAPWIRRIFIATDSDRPEWLADHPSVTFVRAEEHFKDPSVLPTHNSQAVEAQLQHIPGLAEHFLYSNDDMFFGRPVGPDLFFSPGGITKFIEASTRIGLGANDSERSGFENAARVNRRLLWERFGRITTRHLEHTAAPLRKSVLLEMENAFPDEFAATAGSRFRAKDNISVTNSLYHYYALLTARAVTQETAKVKYVDTTSYAGLKQMDKLLAKRNMDLFCLNDGSFPEVPAQERAERVTDFLEKFFPIKAPWEN
ncbi:stealth family protein [Arthrobacter sp. zg-Y820]|uniref:stealth family protein n=1 Tax=unclassified Arthrobacter TaxID=235627 RepID=UPI001E417DBB|nr:MULTISPECIES: stealth family protein [unclassified Arthrobacter]MCC9195479.1 stealth family protein [Arthrobacter sp. zg-Y820]MDK1278338.1 stealth family protein [Arthrobacter sp. zg.Y820]WIB10215.1 stealth family protein [Arthrobacter sp. zg-Y820]